LQNSVATLLLVTAAVVLACVVVNYAVTVAQQTANNASNPEFGPIRDLENNLLNQTYQLLNQTQPVLPGQATP
jgi:hypothetical protein